MPENPPLVLPDDWSEHDCAQPEPCSFSVTADRPTTQANLIAALRQGLPDSMPTALLELTQERVALLSWPFSFGQRMIETLFEAMDHEYVLATSDFWADVQAAVLALADVDPEAFRRPLQSAADRLLAAREVLYPVNVHLLDFCLLDEQHLGRSFAALVQEVARSISSVPPICSRNSLLNSPNALSSFVSVYMNNR